MFSSRIRGLARLNVLQRSYHLSFDSINIKHLENAIKPNVLVLMHGMLGNKRNFKSFLSAFPAKYKEMKGKEDLVVITLDLRGHGDSTQAEPNELPNTVHSCAVDVVKLLNSILSKNKVTSPNLIVCGHSFGGKVAIEVSHLLSNTLDRMPAHTWVIDSYPGAITTLANSDQSRTTQTVWHVLESLKSLPPVFASRQHAVQMLIDKQISPVIAMWLATSIIDTTIVENGENKSVCKFMFDLRTLLELFADFCKSDTFPIIRNMQAKPILSNKSYMHFLIATKNDLWKESGFVEKNSPIVNLHDLNRTNLPAGMLNTKIHTIHTNHWVHAEDPRGFVEVILRNSFN